jgi:acyl-CoA reductase-like NAD-dependent aldehyde dehydrogenase
LNKLADLIEQHRAEFALLESMDVGKPIFESYNFDFQQVINAYRYYAGYADKIHGKTIPIPGNNLCYTKHVPLGVVALIMPWNFPSQLLAWKLAPALATGNTVIIKPAKETPLTTTFLARMIEEAGFPPGVVNVLNGSGSVIGMALCSHMDVDKIGFTGSTDVGRTIQIACAKSNLKPCSLELGGKSPIIVFDDVPDLDACVLDSYYALFWNAGQCCSAGSRIYVHEKVYDDFITKMVDLVKKRKLGDPLDDGVEQGPQVSKAQLNSVSEYIEAGKKENARLVYGGSCPSEFSKGFYLEPTIFADVKDDMKICREEIFGPVMSILKFTDVTDVVKRANDSIYGLVGSVYTKDVSKAIYVSDRVQSGLVWVNCFNVIDSAVPWGGFKQSGHGRDLSKYALQNYTQPKTVIIAPKL